MPAALRHEGPFALAHGAMTRHAFRPMRSWGMRRRPQAVHPARIQAQGPHDPVVTLERHRPRRRPPAAASLDRRRRRYGRGRGSGRRRRADRRAVDDQHRYGRHRRHGAPGRKPRPRRLGAGAHHRRPRRGGGGRAEDQGAARPHRLPRAADRRLPLYRPQAADRSPGLRRGARQVPHQSRQRRLQAEARHAVRDHRREGDPIRQDGSDRRQLGLARPGPADPPDGRERQACEPEGHGGRDARGDAAVGAALGPACRGDRPRPRPHHPVGEGLGGAAAHRRLPDAGGALRLRAASRV